MASKIFPGNNHEMCELKNLQLGVGCKCGEIVSATCKDSRQSPKGYRWRRKQCNECGRIYTTVEINGEYINAIDDLVKRYNTLIDAINTIRSIADGPYKGLDILDGSSGSSGQQKK